MEAQSWGYRGGIVAEPLPLWRSSPVPITRQATTGTFRNTVHQQQILSRTSSQVSLAPTRRETESLDTTLSRLYVGVTTSGTSFRLGILGLCHLSQFLLTGHDGITKQRFFYRQGVPYQTFG
jgi:hypothetical protein